MTDFDALADLAYNRNTLKPADRADLSNLWAAFFKLEQWIFIVDASSAAEQPSPFIGYQDEQPWFFVFTDSDKAYDFAKKNSLLDKNGESLYLSMTPNGARKMLSSAQGHTVGIRVNEGEHGWFAPLENIEAIYKFLIEEGNL